MSSPDKHSGNTRGPIAWMAGHGVAANLIMLACLVGGVGLTCAGLLWSDRLGDPR